MQVVPLASANVTFQGFTAVATASTTSGSNVPANAIDNNGATYWESAAGDSGRPGTGPWLQIDLTRILKVYGIKIFFASNGTNKPANFTLQSSDNPTDQAYGNYAGSGAFDLLGRYTAPTGSTGSYGEFTAFIPATSAGTYGVSTTASTGSFHAVDARYFRIQNALNTTTRIVDVQVFASSPNPNTTSRTRIGGTVLSSGIVSGGTLFTNLSNDLLDVDVMQVLDRQVWSGTVILNNSRQKYARATFPEGTPVKIWIDGTTELLGTITNFDPKYSLRGLTANIDVRGYDDFLNQDIRYAWAATPISDKTQAADIISTGPNSLLGLTVNSVGARVIGSLNTLDARIGPNIMTYYPAKDKSKLQVLNDLAETAIDGAWVLQNTNFAPSLATYGTTLGRSGSGVADGYWFGVRTQPGYQIDLRGTSNGFYLFCGSAIASGSVVTSDTNPPFTWDGNINNDPLYNYAEVFQTVFVPISACSAAGSLVFTAAMGSKSTITTGGLGSGWDKGESVDELIVEAEDKIGRIRRLHYIVHAAIILQAANGVPGTCECTTTSLPAQFNYSGGNIVFPPPDTDADKYINLTGGGGSDACTFGSTNELGGTASRNLYTDWTTRFTNPIDSGGSDVVTLIRIRQYPFPHIRGCLAGGSTPEQSIFSCNWSNIAITPVAHVKNPPTRFDFYVHESSVGSQVPDLYFFPRPRPNLDLSYRNLDGSTNPRWFITQITSPLNSLGSDFNTIESFDFMKGDVYRVKNDITTIGGQAITVTDGFTVDCTNPLYQSRTPGKDTHSSRQEMIQLADMASMTSIGRRPKFTSLNQTDPVELVRETVKLTSLNRLVENRGTIKVRGNAAYQPGYITTVESDYTELAGKYLIHSVQHKWNSSGYICTLNVEDIDFNLHTEFARAQARIDEVSNRGGRGTMGGNKSSKFAKVSTDISGTLFQSLTGANTVGGMDYQQFSLPLNIIPEFSNIRHVKLTITKALGGENRGTPGSFGPAGGSKTGAQNTDANGWSTSNSFSQSNAFSGEVEASDTTYIGMRFITHQSAGSFLFILTGRFPATPATSSGQGGAVLFSLWKDSTITAGTPAPGDPMDGFSNDVTQGQPLPIYGDVTSPFLGALTQRVSRAEVQGWVSVPASLVTHIGNDKSETSNQVYTAVEVGLQTPVPPKTKMWLVCRTISAGNFWIGYDNTFTNAQYPIERSATAGKGGIALDRWTAAAGGGTLLSSAPASFTAYPMAPVNSAGAWQPDRTSISAHFPGTVGITSAATNQSILNIPIISDRNGVRQDMTRTLIFTDSNNPGYEGIGTGLWTVEPVTKESFVAISIPGQAQIAEIGFPTSQVATRDTYGDVFVAYPASSGSTPFGVRKIRRLAYTMEVQYNEF